LAAFLRSRRALITPDDAGLAPGLRRRTPGLRREEVAQLAGVGVTWYTWLEQGRPINASPQVLDAVAGVLRLDHAEHTHLYRLADVPEAPIPAAVTCLPPEVQVVLDGLATMPACVYNGKFDLLAWNASYATLFPSITAEGADRNALWDWFMNGGSDNPLGTADCLGQMAGSRARPMPVTSANPCGRTGSSACRTPAPCSRPCGQVTGFRSRCRWSRRCSARVRASSTPAP